MGSARGDPCVGKTSCSQSMVSNSFVARPPRNAAAAKELKHCRRGRGTPLLADPSLKLSSPLPRLGRSARGCPKPEPAAALSGAMDWIHDACAPFARADNSRAPELGRSQPTRQDGAPGSGSETVLTFSRPWRWVERGVVQGKNHEAVRLPGHRTPEMCFEPLHGSAGRRHTGQDQGKGKLHS